MSSTNILIKIAGEFQKKGFDDANKATGKLGSAFEALGKKLVAAFSVGAVVNWAKQSVKAFEDDQRAATQLANAVKNVGLQFSNPAIAEYIKDLEKSANIADDVLRPAMQRLIQTTGSVSKSQEMLNTAIEVSRGSGVSLETVVSDLSRAYVGQTRGLIKYNLGLTQTELKGKKVEEIVKLLNKQYSGSNAAYLETYTGKTEALNIAYDNLQETIGGALVDSFARLSGDQGIKGATKAMEEFGTTAADYLNGVSISVSALSEKSGFLGEIFKAAFAKAVFPPGTKEIFDWFMRVGKEERKQQEYWDAYQKFWYDQQAAAEQAKKDAELKAKTDAAELAKAKALAKERAKAAAALAKEKALKAGRSMFDINAIQIEAALKGQINEVEENRLKLQRAILNENVNEVIKYQGLLKDSEGQLATLQELLASLPEKAKNPFTDWPAVIGQIQTLVKDLNIQIPIETLFADKGLKLDQNAMTVTQLTTMTVTADTINILGGNAGNSSTAATGTVTLGSQAVAGLPVLAQVPSMPIFDSQPVAGLPIGVGAPPQVVVNVTVQGNVTSENDLVAVITEAAQNNDKYGIPFMYDRYAI